MFLYLTLSGLGWDTGDLESYRTLCGSAQTPAVHMGSLVVHGLSAPQHVAY